MIKKIQTLATLSKMSIHAFATVARNSLMRSCLQLIGGFILFAASVQSAHALSAPTISLATGSFSSPQPVSMSASSGAIFYTTDGSAPSISSTLFTTVFTVSSPTQINAVAYQSGTYSAVTTVYLDVDTALTPILQSGLILRLRSDFGVVEDVGSPAPVNQWIDLSGSNNTASGATGSQPTLTAKATGNYGVNFNGTSQFLSLPSGLSNFNSGASFFLVVQPASPSSDSRLFDFGNGTAADNLYMSEPSANAADLHIYNISTDSSVSASSAIAAGQFQLLEGIYNGATDAIIYTNGVQDAQSSSMQIPRNVTRSSNFIGQSSAGGNFYSGQIAEILIYSTVLTLSQRVAVEEYLVNKFQLLSVAPPAPVSSIAGGVLSGPSEVSIASRGGTTTRLTADGTTPTQSSQIYVSPLTGVLQPNSQGNIRA